MHVVRMWRAEHPRPSVLEQEIETFIDDEDTLQFGSEEIVFYLPSKDGKTPTVAVKPSHLPPESVAREVVDGIVNSTKLKITNFIHLLSESDGNIKDLLKKFN